MTTCPSPEALLTQLDEHAYRAAEERGVDATDQAHATARWIIFDQLATNHEDDPYWTEGLALVQTCLELLDVPSAMLIRFDGWTRSADLSLPEPAGAAFRELMDLCGIMYRGPVEWLAALRVEVEAWLQSLPSVGRRRFARPLAAALETLGEVLADDV